MLDDEICKLRDKLNKSIENGEDYSVIYQLSIELDELIAQYYAKNSKKKTTVGGDIEKTIINEKEKSS